MTYCSIFFRPHRTIHALGIYLATIIFSTFSAYAQVIIENDSSSGDLKPQENFQQPAATDSIGVTHKVMIIPYDPLFYLSDADRDIALDAHMEPGAFRERFRQSIAMKVKQMAARQYPAFSLLDVDSLPQLTNAIQNIYSQTGYRYDKPLPLPFKSEQNENESKELKKNNNLASDSRTAPLYKIVVSEERFMNAVIGKAQVLRELKEHYGADIFVFLNQLEIKTNYKNCLDIANQVYQRQVMLHFSIFDAEGNIRAGTCVASSFPSNSNHPDEIIQNCFPQLAGFVVQCIP